MKLLTKNSDYAIRSMIILAKNKDKYLSAREIAVQLKIPYQFLRKILRGLIQNKLVHAREGQGGGVRINAAAKAASIIDIIKIYQGGIQISECVFRRKICPELSTCMLRKEIKRIEKIVEKEFSKIRLTKFIETKN